MKKYLIVPIIFICCFVFAGCQTEYRNQTFYLGDLQNLLKEANLEMRSVLIKESGLEKSDFVLYTFKYNVFINGSTDREDLIPILSPEYYKNILAVKTDFPLVELHDPKSHALPYGLDQKWIEQEKLKEETYTFEVSYLMDVNSFNSLPENIMLSDLYDEETKQAFTKDSDFKSVEQLLLKEAFSKHKNTKTLADLSRIYGVWIKQNIHYPEGDSFDSLRRKYVNVKSVEKTLKNKVGVCEDNAILFSKMLNYSGIKTELYITIVPKHLDEEWYGIGSLRYHEIVGIPTNQGVYFFDPTTQGSKQTKILKMSDGMILKVSNDMDEELKALPTIMEPIKHFGVRGIDASYTFKSMKYESFY